MPNSSDVSPEVTFHDFALRPELIQAIDQSGYTIPTPIQAQSIPVLLEGRDLLGQAQTGTGKTAAFALPMLHRINIAKRQPQVLVLTPTRELAIQVADAFERYAEFIPGFCVAAIYGGQDYMVQFRQLDKGPHVIVGTPGRLVDHMRRESLKLSELQGLVLDEADEMLKMGFTEDVDWILSQLPKTRQSALFSATIPDQIRHIASKHLTSPVEITIQQKSATADTVEQRYVVAAPAQKQLVLSRVLEAEAPDGTIVFVKTRDTCEPLAEYLMSQGHRAAALHGAIAQKQRERIVDNLRAGHLDVVVATDVAARGLDVKRISHVINYDLPFDSEAYVHRIGRTGRAGRTGQAILFVSPREKGRLKRLENATRQRIEPMDVPGNREINIKRVQQFHVKISEAINSSEMEAFESVIEQFRRANPDIAIEKIAAAVAVMANNGKSLLERGEFKSSGFDAGSSRKEFDRPKKFGGRGERRERGSSDAGMETFRVEVGHDDRVAPGNLVGAIANEAGLDSADIGRIRIHDRYSTIDLPSSLSDDIVIALRRVQVLGKRLNISRERNSPFKGQSDDRQDRPHADRPNSDRPRPERSGKDRPQGDRSGKKKSKFKKKMVTA